MERNSFCSNMPVASTLNKEGKADSAMWGCLILWSYQKEDVYKRQLKKEIDNLLVSQNLYSKNYKIDEDWENLINKYLKCRKLNNCLLYTSRCV